MPKIDEQRQTACGLTDAVGTAVGTCTEGSHSKVPFAEVLQYNPPEKLYAKAHMRYGGAGRRPAPAPAPAPAAAARKHMGARRMVTCQPVAIGPGLVENMRKVPVCCRKRF